MKILGIESSCDETAAAVVEDGVKVLSNVIASQAKLHAKTGGVVPEVAAREHATQILPVVRKALRDAKCGMEKIDAVAVAHGPGLISSLLVGTTAANMIALLARKPLIGVKHILGHVYAPFLETKTGVEFPFLTLSVSGGHNELFLMRGHFDYEVLGETLDDAAGEAFDKVARMLDLSYPGGPAIEALAKKGDGKAVNFPRGNMMKKMNEKVQQKTNKIPRNVDEKIVEEAAGSDSKSFLDFSFSGLKTAVLYYLEKKRRITPREKADIAASFQEAVCDMLADRVIAALEMHPEVREVHLTGGVSANGRLRAVLEERLKQFEKNADLKDSKNAENRQKNTKNVAAITFRVPAKLSYCTDNGAMIACAAYFMYQRQPQKYREWKYVQAMAEV